THRPCAGHVQLDVASRVSQVAWFEPRASAPMSDVEALSLGAPSEPPAPSATAPSTVLVATRGPGSLPTQAPALSVTVTTATRHLERLRIKKLEPDDATVKRLNRGRAQHLRFPCPRKHRLRVRPLPVFG